MENPNVVFYYKGFEPTEGVPKALGSIVAFDVEDALVIEAVEAERLCEDLNKDKESLTEHGFTAFECWTIIKEPTAEMLLAQSSLG